MNTNDLEMLSLAVLAGSVSLTLFIIAGNYILNALRTLSSAQALSMGKSPGTQRPPNGSQQRKVQINPNIICLLPIHEEKRPEARLW
jgi:hypothetical protein